MTEAQPIFWKFLFIGGPLERKLAWGNVDKWLSRGGRNLSLWFDCDIFEGLNCSHEDNLLSCLLNSRSLQQLTLTVTVGTCRKLLERIQSKDRAALDGLTTLNLTIEYEFNEQELAPLNFDFSKGNPLPLLQHLQLSRSFCHISYIPFFISHPTLRSLTLKNWTVTRDVSRIFKQKDLPRLQNLTLDRIMTTEEGDSECSPSCYPSVKRCTIILAGRHSAPAYLRLLSFPSLLELTWHRLWPHWSDIMVGFIQRSTQVLERLRTNKSGLNDPVLIGALATSKSRLVKATIPKSPSRTRGRSRRAV